MRLRAKTSLIVAGRIIPPGGSFSLEPGPVLDAVLARGDAEEDVPPVAAPEPTPLVLDPPPEAKVIEPSRHAEPKAPAPTHKKGHK